MKHNPTLITLASALLCPLAMAAFEWQEPTVAGMELVEGEPTYLYNVKSSMFLKNNGNKATVDAEGTPVVFFSDGGNNYHLCNSTDIETATCLRYTDVSLVEFNIAYDALNTTWTVTRTDDGGYRFRPDVKNEEFGEEYFPDCFTGWPNNGTNAVWAIVDAEEEDCGLDWRLCDEDEYRRFGCLKALNDAMHEAVEKELDITAALAVYEDPNSSNEDINEATLKVKKDIMVYNIGIASLDNPVDLSDILTNPSFDLNYAVNFETDRKKIEGWTVEPYGSFTLDNAQCYDDKTSVGRWAWGDQTFTDAKMYQAITDAPNGKYLMRVAYTCIDQEPDGDEEIYDATGNTLYATTSHGTAVANLASSSRWGTETAEVEFYVTDGKLEVGVEMQNSTANWFKMGGFELTYYGNDALSMELESVIDEAESAEGACYEPYRDQLNDLIEKAKAMVENGASVDEMTDMMAKLQEATKAVVDNIMMWYSVSELMEAVNEMEADVENRFIVALKAYAEELQADDNFVDFQYDNEKLAATIAKLDLLMQQATHSVITPGTDATEFIVNPDFAEKDKGWTIEGVAAEDLGYSNNLLEIDGKVVDVHQTLLGMPNGVYRLTVQGFQRTTWNFEEMDEQWANGQEDELRGKINSFLYLNDGQVCIKHAFDDGFSEEFASLEGNWDIRKGEKTGVMMPNTPSGARQYFEKGYYTNEVEAFVVDGTLTFGIRNVGNQGAHWGCFDNFRLVYVGQDLDKAIALLKERLEDVKPYLDIKMNGRMKQALTDAYNKGMQIVNGDVKDFDLAIELVDQLFYSPQWR